MTDATLAQSQVYHDAGKVPRVVAVFILLLGAWGYARLGGVSPLPAPNPPPVASLTLGPFPNPLHYSVAPPPGLSYIHVRTGPGKQFKIARRLNGSLIVIALARADDKAGHPWVKLRRGGYAREDLLRPVPAAPQP